MSETIFSKILSGEIPSHKIYEDELVYAFLDINPLSLGHTLLIPKEPAATMDQLSDESAAALGRVLPRLCRAVTKAVGVNDYNILQNNGTRAHQEVMHLHFHIIPKPSKIAISRKTTWKNAQTFCLTPPHHKVRATQTLDHTRYIRSSKG